MPPLRGGVGSAGGGEACTVCEVPESLLEYAARIDGPRPAAKERQALMTIQIVGVYGSSGYLVFKDADPHEDIASDQELLSCLKNHGVSERDARACIQQVRASREITVTVPGQ